MTEIITDLKALKLHGMAKSYAELLEQGGNVALQTSQWLIERLLQAEHTFQAMRTIASMQGSPQQAAVVGHKTG